MNIRKSVANIVAMFCPTRKMRRAVRIKIIGKTGLSATDFAVTSVNIHAKIKEYWRKNVSTAGPNPGRFDTYDLVFAIGSSCKMVDVLNFMELRQFATPLDWTAGVGPARRDEAPTVWHESAFDAKIDAIISEFEDWFRFEDIVVFKTVSSATGHQYVYNTRTGVLFMHVFPWEESLEQYYPTAYKTMMRRAVRLVRAIKASERVLICWGHRMQNQRNVLDKTVSDSQIHSALSGLRQKYPNVEFDMVFFEHDGKMSQYEYEQVDVCVGARRVRSNHFFQTDDKYWTPTVIGKCLANISLTNKLADFLPHHYPLQLLSLP